MGFNQLVEEYNQLLSEIESREYVYLLLHKYRRLILSFEQYFSLQIHISVASLHNQPFT
jgi:hypothetical protein